MNRDFAEMLKALSDEGVEYLVVGAYAVAAHGIPRATGDIDLWVRPTQENAVRLWRALERFGAPRSRLTPETFTKADIVYQIGLPPNRIDLLTTIDGVEFEAAWQERVECVVDKVSFRGPSGIFVGSSVGQNAAFPRRQGACSTRSSSSRFSA